MRIHHLARLCAFCVLLQPAIASAVQIGDIQLESPPGAPLAARVPLIVQPGEQYQYGVYSVRTYQERTPDGTVMRNITKDVSILLFQGSPPYLRINGPAPTPGMAVHLTVDARLGATTSSRDFSVASRGVVDTISMPATPVRQTVASPGQAFAADTPSYASRRAGGYWDVRVTAGIEPPIEDAEYKAGSFDIDGKWDAPGGMVELAISHRFASGQPHSGYVRFGGFAAGFKGDNDQDSRVKLEMRSGGVHVGGGYSFKRTDFYALEAGPSLSIGYANAKETVPGQVGDYSADGAYLRFGAGAANLFNFGAFQLGLNAGIASTLAFVTYDEQDLVVDGQSHHLASVDATYKGTLVYAGVSLGFRN